MFTVLVDLSPLSTSGHTDSSGLVPLFIFLTYNLISLCSTRSLRSRFILSALFLVVSYRHTPVLFVFKSSLLKSTSRRIVDNVSTVLPALDTFQVNQLQDIWDIE